MEKTVKHPMALSQDSSGLTLHRGLKMLFNSFLKACPTASRVTPLNEFGTVRSKSEKWTPWKFLVRPLESFNQPCNRGGNSIADSQSGSKYVSPSVYQPCGRELGQHVSNTVSAKNSTSRGATRNLKQYTRVSRGILFRLAVGKRRTEKSKK